MVFEDDWGMAVGVRRMVVGEGEIDGGGVEDIKGVEEIAGV